MSTSAFGIVHKSQLPSGAYKAASKLTRLERATLKVNIQNNKPLYPGKIIPAKGTRYAAQGRFRGPQKFEDDNADAIDTVHAMSRAAKAVKAKTNKGVRIATTEEMPSGAIAQTVRTGGKNTGTSTVTGSTSELKPYTIKERNQVFRHEMQHAKPKRSAFRLAQVISDPAKLGREEARADRVVPMIGQRGAGRVGYDKMIASDKIANAASTSSLTNQRSVPHGFAAGYNPMRSKLNAIDHPLGPRALVRRVKSKFNREG